MSDQIATQPKTPEEKFYDDLINNHRFNRPDKRKKQFNKTIGRESVFIKKLSMLEKKEFDTTKNFLIAKFRIDQLNETTKKIKEGAQVKCLFFNLAKKDDDDFLNILRSGTFDYEDGVSDTNYEVKTVSIPKKMNYSLTSNDIIQDDSIKSSLGSSFGRDDNNQTNNSEHELLPEASPVKSDSNNNNDDDDDISKEIEVVGMPDFNSPPPKPNNEIEENRKYKRKISKFEYSQSDDILDDNNSLINYDDEVDRLDGDIEKSQNSLSVISKRINDESKSNITNSSINVFVPGFNSRPKLVIPKMPTLPPEILIGQRELFDRLDTLERRGYKGVSELKQQYRTFTTLLENIRGVVDLAKSTNAQQQQQSLQVITQGQDSLKGIYQDGMTGAMQQMASSFNIVNQKEDALALGLHNLQQSQNANQQALIGYSNSTNSNLQTLNSEISKLNTNISDLVQKPTPTIQNTVNIPPEATSYISSVVKSQVETSLGGVIDSLNKGIKDIVSVTKKIEEYNQPQQSSSIPIVEEPPDLEELIGGVNSKLDDNLQKIFSQMLIYRSQIIKAIQDNQTKSESESLLAPIQSMEERMLNTIKDNIDSSFSLIRANNEELYNKFISGIDLHIKEKYLQPVLDQETKGNLKIDSMSRLLESKLASDKLITENMASYITGVQNIPKLTIEGIKSLNGKSTDTITSHVSAETGKIIKSQEQTKSAVLDQNKKLGEIETKINQILQFYSNQSHNTDILDSIKQLSSDINEQRALAIKQNNSDLDGKLKSYDDLLKKIFENQSAINAEFDLMKKDKLSRRKYKDEQRQADKAEYYKKLDEFRDDIKEYFDSNNNNGNNGNNNNNDNSNDDDDDDDDDIKKHIFDEETVDSKGYIRLNHPDVYFFTTTREGTEIMTRIVHDHLPNYLSTKSNVSNNNNSKSPDSLLKLLVQVSNNNNGNIKYEDIGEIQDLNGEITDLYSDLQSLKSDIIDADKKGDTATRDTLISKYNNKKDELNKCIAKYSKELYRLSVVKKKTKATFASHNYLMNKLNQLN